MKHKDWLDLHKGLTARMYDITSRKNADYTGASDDAFSNFRIVESLGFASVEQGFMTRMSDKMSRLATFVKKGVFQVEDEKVEDTLLDLANYSLLFIGYLADKKQSTEDPKCGCKDAPEAS